MKKVLRYLLLLSIFIYVISALFIYFRQDSMLYFPTPPKKSIYTHKSFNLDGASIYSSIVNPKKEDAIIYFGGNAEDVDTNYNPFKIMFRSHSVYLIHYRGYGNSSGEPNEDALYSDALNIYDALKKEHKDISVIGRSLGTGVATYLASKRDVDRLILVTPYDSIENVAQQRFKIFPISWMIRDRYNSKERVKEIRCATLILYAQNDKVIPKERTDALVDAFAGKELTLSTIEAATHNSIIESPQYFRALKRFLH
jgi:pimeloyl-ACP methyl ester carboxylesterase